MAVGKVCTGFSKPYIAIYSASQGAITYSNVQVLARGVEVNLEPESSDDNNFYADNQMAESASGAFKGAELTLTVDGLLIAAERTLMGLPAADADGFTAYDDNQNVPYVGVGFVARYMSDGITSYVPIVLTKCKFNQIPTTAVTEEDEIDWQTQELVAVVMRADDADHTWKYVGPDCATEVDAVTALVGKLS